MAKIVPASPVGRTAKQPAFLTKILACDRKRAPFRHGKRTMNSPQWRTKSKISHPNVNVTEADRSNRHGQNLGRTLHETKEVPMSATTAPRSSRFRVFAAANEGSGNRLRQPRRPTANLPWVSDALFSRESRLSNITSDDARRIR